MTIPHGERGEDPTVERLRELTRNIEAITESIREDRKSQKERSEELNRRMKETDRQMQETDRRLKKAEDLFTTQWGKLMESLVRGDLVRLLDGRGIGVRSLAQRTLTRRGGESYEVDIMAVNGEEIVVVEVKTTLRPEDVGRFRYKLGRFKEWWPEYRDRKVFGAMAWLQASDDVALHAERQGFFVIRATGDSASIVNAKDFEPRVFA